jgi:hypothetical protein
MDCGMVMGPYPICGSVAMAEDSNCKGSAKEAICICDGIIMGIIMCGENCG